MNIKVTDIQYDTDGEDVELPSEIEVFVPEYLTDEEKLDFISDAISEITGYCHKSFSTYPKI